MIVAETVRLRDIDWDTHLQAIRRAVTAEHELPPDAVYLVRNSSVPKTSSGKIQRHACLHARPRWRTERSLPNGSAGRNPRESCRRCGAPDDASRGGTRRTSDALGSDEDVNPSIVEAIKYHVRNIAGERANELSLDTNIVLDFGLDSLERLEIARNLERTFGGRFPEQVLDEIETIGQTALAIQRYLPPGGEARAEALLSGAVDQCGQPNGSASALRGGSSTASTHRWNRKTASNSLRNIVD